jgi:hypothetical protein
MALEDTGEMRGYQWPIPDGFRVDPASRSVEAWEVEVTHHLSQAQLNIYAELWFGFDCEGWILRLYRRDISGEHEVDLCALWYEFLKEQTERK